MKNMIHFTIATWCLVALSGCTAEVSADTNWRNPIGQECRVELRRDLLGVQSPSGLDADDQTGSGRVVGLKGQLLSFSKDELVLSTSTGSQLHIPVNSVLYYESFPAKAEDGQ